MVGDDGLRSYTGRRFAAAACNVFGGHNGVLIEIGDGSTNDVEPQWPVLVEQHPRPKGACERNFDITVVVR